jgi:heme/copper-type cytochrome/quinol oxidase subunit 3
MAETETSPVARVIPLHRSIGEDFRNNIGMALFLFSWGITFAGLAIAYLVVWWRAADWPPVGTPPRPLLLPILNTALVLGSSVTYDLAVRSARRNRPGAVRQALLATGVLAVGFLALQNMMWVRLWHAGLRLGVNNFAGLFYALTWFHAAHVFAGVLILLALAPRAMRGGFTSREHTVIRLSGWFWHFVTAAWLVVFVLLWIL